MLHIATADAVAAGRSVSSLVYIRFPVSGRRYRRVPLMPRAQPGDPNMGNFLNDVSAGRCSEASRTSPAFPLPASERLLE